MDRTVKLAAFCRQTGLALIGAGVLIVVINAIVTPLLPRDLPLSAVASSTVFAIRQSLALLAALLLLVGTIGVHLSHVDHVRRAGVAAFALAFCGTALLVATEWTQLIEVRDLALRAPDTLDRLDSAGMGLDDVGALVAFSMLVTGWILLAVVARRSGRFSARATTLVIAGFFATPLLHAIAPAVVAGALGSVVLGAGWILLGLEIVRHSMTERAREQ